jgi:hypothetical protein
MESAAETVADLAGPDELAVRQARTAFADLLESLRAAIHLDRPDPDAALHALAAIGQAWAADQALTGTARPELPFARTGERDVVATLLAIAAYGDREPDSLAELAEAIRQFPALPAPETASAPA